MTRAGAALAVVAVIIYLVCVALQLDRPLMYDDANFALAARAVADTGQPFGNQGWMSDRGDFSQREQWAVWHPPMYIYLDGLLAKIGGWTPPVLRLLGVLGGLATALLTWLLARDLTRGPPAAKAIGAGLAVALVVLSPLVVQSTLILDIDFTLLLPLSLLWLWLYLRLENIRWTWLWLTPVFALALWAKMTNPVPLVAVAVVWQALRGKPARAGRDLAVIGIAGIGLFLVSWLLVSRALGWPADMPFGVNLAQWRDSTDVARRAYTSPSAFVEGLQPTVIWLGPGLVALGLVGVAVRSAQLLRFWRFMRADLVIGFTTVLVLGYVNKSAGWFPKYQVALAPLLACIAAPLFAYAVCVRPRLALAVGHGAAIAAAVVTLALVRDQWALSRTWAIDPIAGAWLLGIVLVGALLGLRWRMPAAAAVVAIVGVALGWSVGVDAFQVRARYQTDYWYGTTGVPEATAWVDANLAPDQTYVASKEVAIRSTDQRYVDQDTLVYLLSIGQWPGNTWAGEPLHALVIWEREPYVADLLGQKAGQLGFAESARFGDYVVYVPVSS